MANGKRIQFRMSEEEQLKVREYADTHNISVNDLVRKSLLDVVNKTQESQTIIEITNPVEDLIWQIVRPAELSLREVFNRPLDEEVTLDDIWIIIHALQKIQAAADICTESNIRLNRNLKQKGPELLKKYYKEEAKIKKLIEEETGGD